MARNLPLVAIFWRFEGRKRDCGWNFAMDSTISGCVNNLPRDEADPASV